MLSVPSAERKHFRRNFIKQAVCELRFPVLYELEGPKPPAAFARALRKDYPNQGLQEGLMLSMGVGAPPSRATSHVFRSKQNRWTINLQPSTLSIETNQYSSYEDFESRIAFLVDASKDIIDSEFYTRIGIRYINAFPFDPATIANWLNPDLAPALGKGVFGSVTEFGHRVRGFIPGGGFYLAHGIAAPPNENQTVSFLSSGRTYSVDLDFSAEDVELKDAMEVVRALHTREYDLFMWCLGPEAKKYLEA